MFASNTNDNIGSGNDGQFVVESMQVSPNNKNILMSVI